MEMMDTSMLLMSETDSTSDSSFSMTKPKRKRQRLDHLSQEEKMMRRKLKNRMAAQSARDRKKVKMQDLEEEVTLLTKQRNILVKQNEALKKRNTLLEDQNKELKQRLSLLETMPSIKVENNCPNDWSEAFKSAEGTGLTSGQTDIASAVIDDAIRLLADKQSDGLLDVLNIYSEELLESEESDTNCSQMQSTNDSTECQQTSLLGSIKDLIYINDNTYLNTTETNNLFEFIDNNKTNNNNNNNYPLSPLSCNSDSGYESVSSPSLSLSDPFIDSSNVCLEETITELFPDLV